VVAAGQPLARVGLSGDTEFPHLHLTVRHGTEVVDPFAPAPVTAPACVAQPSLWAPAAARQLAYKRGAVLNLGFGAALSPMEAVEARTIAAPTAASPAVVAYVRTIGLEAGDVVELSLRGPDGRILATASEPPLDHDKAQWLNQIGRKVPPGGWPRGVYTAEAKVHRSGGVVMTKRWEMRL